MDDASPSHGTHVSGTIAGVGNNSIGVAGVNWVGSILGAKFLNSSGSGTDSDAINAIEFTVQAKIALGAGANVRVLSNSWGGGAFSQALLAEINRANTYNMLFVAAAGNNASNNDTTPFYPANYAAPNVVSVAATDNKDQLASFSDYGATTVHLGAPGNNVYSTLANNNYGYLSGTSMATPHVSGAAALVLSVCPNLQTSALKSTILGNVDADQALSVKTATGGRLNVNKAVRNCSATTDTVSVTWSLLSSNYYVQTWGADTPSAFSPTTLTDGKTYAAWYDIDSYSRYGTFSITSSTNPGQSWLIYVTILGVTQPVASATYRYSGTTATWQWGPTGAFGFGAGANPATGVVVHQ